MVKAAGLAEGMTPELAEHLYGPDGGALCGALDSSAEFSGIAWARTRVPQLPADHVRNLVAYDRTCRCRELGHVMRPACIRGRLYVCHP